MSSSEDKIKILVVDDEFLCRKAIVTFAQNLKLPTDEAKNEEEAIEEIKTSKYNLILINLTSDMKGIEVAKCISKLPNANEATLVAYHDRLDFLGQAFIF